MRGKILFVLFVTSLLMSSCGNKQETGPVNQEESEAEVQEATEPEEDKKQEAVEGPEEVEEPVEEIDPVQEAVEKWLNGVGLTPDDIGTDSDIYKELENLADMGYLCCPGTPNIVSTNYGKGYDYKGTNYPTWSAWDKAFLADHQEEIEAIEKERGDSAEAFDYFEFNNLDPADTNDGEGYDIRVYHYDTLGEYRAASEAMSDEMSTAYSGTDMALIDSLPEAEREEVMRIRMEAEYEENNIFSTRLCVIEEALEPLILEARNLRQTESPIELSDYDPNTKGGEGFEYCAVTYATFGEYIYAVNAKEKIDEMRQHFADEYSVYRAYMKDKGDESYKEFWDRFRASDEETDFDKQIQILEELISDLENAMEPVLDERGGERE